MNLGAHPKAVLAELEQSARKRFGQHFLHRLDIVAQIVRAAGVKPGDRVLEVGPGLGILTDALMMAGAEVTVVEFDRDLAARLRRERPTLQIIEADATKLSWPDVLEGSGWSMVSNLPYNVGTGILMSTLRAPQTFGRATVMLQAEVIDRLLARPGSKTYGALSVERWLYADARAVLQVSPSAFHPPPKVHSTVARFDLRTAAPVEGTNVAAVERLTRVAFSQRRKTLRNALRAVYGREGVASMLAHTGISGEKRAEVLDPEQFVALARAVDA